MKPLINFMLTTPKPVFVKSIKMGDQEHTEEYIYGEIQKVIEDFNPKKISAVITDNADGRSSIFSIHTYTAMGVQLLAQDIYKKNTSMIILKNAKVIIKLVKYRHVPRATLQRIHKENDKDSKITTVKFPVTTRWSSNAQVLKRVY